MLAVPKGAEPRRGGGGKGCERGTFELSRRVPVASACRNKSVSVSLSAGYVSLKDKGTSAIKVQYSSKLTGKSGGSVHRKKGA